MNTIESKLDRIIEILEQVLEAKSRVSKIGIQNTPGKRLQREEIIGFVERIGRNA